ncbi:hypothetical protein K9M74_00560 [Candidatus Woesearchaeota archaeon]|nr:hypothetical protein [Candidatus Woesearchaeota archaeon]
MNVHIMRRSIAFFIATLVLLFAVQGALAAEDRSFTVVNSKDWQDLFLGTIYASATNSDIIFFTNLADTQLKTKMMTLDDSIMVFESKNNPVVKNYPSLLKVNGYNDYDSIFYDSFHDLQEIMVDDLGNEIEGYFVFEASFGMNPVAATPYIVKKNYFPLFLDEQSKRFIKSTTNNEETFIVGRVPIRFAQDLQGTRIDGFSYESLETVTNLVIDEFPDSEWGLLTRIDLVDLESIKKPLPVLVYYGDEYIDTLANLVKQTDISNFEVIGGPTVDIARTLEIRSQRNLNFMLKYGRRVTNYPGYTNEVLDLDSVRFAYPVELLDIVNATYYEAMGILAITYENQGNVDLLHFSNLEFAGSALSDVMTHFILEQEQKTIPFQILPETEKFDLTVTTRYGESIPLKFEIGSDKDTLFYQEEVAVISDYQETAEIEYVSSIFDTTTGELELVYNNPTAKPVHIYAELIVSNADVVSSPVITIQPGEKEDLVVATPFISDEFIVGQTIDVITYYGHRDTLLSQTNSFVVKAKGPFSALTGWVTLDYDNKPVGASVTTLLILAIIAGIIFFILKRRKQDTAPKKPTKSLKSSTKRSLPKKKSANKSSKKSTRKSSRK